MVLVFNVSIQTIVLLGWQPSLTPAGFYSRFPSKLDAPANRALFSNDRLLMTNNGQTGTGHQ